MTGKGPWKYGLLAVFLVVPVLLLWHWRHSLFPHARETASRKASPGDMFSKTSPILISSAPSPSGSASTVSPAVVRAAGSEPSPPSAGKDVHPLPAAPSGQYALGTAGKDVHPLPAAAVGNIQETSHLPKIVRDPTLSPGDIQEMERRRLMEKMAASKGFVKKKPSRRVKPREPRIEDRIVLMAIIETPTSTRAIVNDKVVREGDQVLGVRIAHVRSDHVVFRYKNKKFIKKVPKP